MNEREEAICRDQIGVRWSQVTVSELIEELNKYPPNSQVVFDSGRVVEEMTNVRCGEYFSDIDKVHAIKVGRDRTKWIVIMRDMSLPELIESIPDEEDEE